ncbi:MAG: hypothetical protein AAF581_19515 [Planctomycetota bacterium]
MSKVQAMILAIACIGVGFAASHLTQPGVEAQADPAPAPAPDECDNWLSFEPPIIVPIKECIEGRWTIVDYELKYCEEVPSVTFLEPTGNSTPTSNPCP